jgi:hypothetical protein
LSNALTDLQPLTLEQIARVSDLPDRAVKYDGIGRKLELLGLAEPTATPATADAGADLTPTASLPTTPPTPPVAPRR